MWWSKQAAPQPPASLAKTGQSRRRTPLMMQLEPRFMFDGAAVVSHADALHLALDQAHHNAIEATGALPVTNAAPVAAPAPTGPAVIFVDSRVTDSASLLKDVAPGTEIVTLQASQDGLQQISSYLAQHHEVGSVEILAHGNDGELLLGDTNLTNANINAYADTLKSIGSNLKAGADILVYSCDTAADANGVAFVDTLAQLTGHTVAASSNVTGVDGDWTLEVTTGDITAKSALSTTAEANYQYDLGAIAVTSSADDGSAGTLRYDISIASAGDVIYFDGTAQTVTLTQGALSISKSITIESDVAGDGASGSQVTINANYKSGVLNITGGNVKLIGLTIEHGLISGNGGGYGSLAGGSALGAGIFASGSSTIVSMNHVTVSYNYATGGGGAGDDTGSLTGYVFAGGGGSGAAGTGGGTGGTYNNTTHGFKQVYAGAAGSSGSGGIGGYGQATPSLTRPSAGKGGTSGISAVAGAGGSGSYANGNTYVVAGGTGGKAGTGARTISGGGGGAADNYLTGANGGSAAGGLYVGNGAKAYVTNATFSQNYGAGGGGGGGWTGQAGNGGNGAGAIMVGATGILKYQSSSVTLTANEGVGGAGGHTNTGMAGTSGASAGATTIENLGSAGNVSVLSAPTVSSINRVGSATNNGTSEQFTVTFSEAVTGVAASDFTLTDSNTVTGIISSVTGSGTTYTVTVGSVAGDGTMRLDLNSSGTAIVDAVAQVPITSGFTSGQTYTIDHTAPTDSSISRTGATPNNGSTETFTVTFSESVTGVATSDFTLATTGSASGTIASVSGSGTTYTVTVNGVTGDGTLGLNLKSGTSITDLAGNAESGSFTGQVYTVDHTLPTVTSITALGSSTNNANSEQFHVVFSEAVTGVNAADFNLTTTNTPGGTALTTGGIVSITTSDNTTYTVTIGGVAGDGTLRLDLKANDAGITDAAGNGATAAFTGGDVYTIEHTPPSVSSIVATGSNPNNASSESFTVTFNENVSGVNAGDFGVNLTGSANYTGLSVTPISGSTYAVTVTGVTGDGTLQLTVDHSSLDITDAAGNVLNADYTSGQTYTIEHTPPTVTSVGVPSNSTYIAGQNLDFTVHFSEAVTVDTSGGTPEIGVTLDTGGTVYAQYVSGSGTSALVFRYTVVGGEKDLTGITLDGAITANGGTINDAATNSAALTLNSVGNTSGVDVNSIPPTVTSVSVPGNQTYGTGQALDFTVNFSENVLVTTGGGTPYIDLTLDTGGTVHAAYVGGSNSNQLTFEYTVANGNDDMTGVALGSSIVLNGGAIKDAATNSAVLTLNSVASTTNVLVDAIPPTVSSIDIAGTSPNNATTETYTVTFSAPVHGVDASDFTVAGTGTASGSISTVSGSGTTWTVVVGSVTGDGTLRLDLNNAGDPITDNFGNQLTAAHTGDHSYTIEHTPPAVTSVTVPGNATYVAGQNLDFTTTFSEAVTVNTSGGTPRIALTLDTGGTVYADYVSGSGTNTLTFRYTVVAGNQDLTGIASGSAIDLNGGTIKDAATNSASGAGLNMTGEPSLAGVDVDAIVPAVSSVAVPVNGTYGTNTDLDFTVNFTKVVNVDTGGGTPYITVTLDTGGTVDAFYFSGSGSTALTFRYVVPSGKLDTNGITVGSSIVTNGGTIQDAIGNDTATTLNSVGSTTGVLVDSILPTVTSIDTVVASTNNLSTETFTVTFSTDVSLSPPDTTDFTLHKTGSIAGTISSVTAVSGSVYTVTVTGVTGDGTMRLDLNASGTTITDAYSNQLTAAHTGDQSYTIEHTPPSATAMTVPSDGTYGVSQALDFTVTFSEAVTVDTSVGTPRIAITLDTGGTVYADYVSGSGTGTLTFRYTPTAGVQDLTGIVTGTAIEANGATIKDAATNNAVLAINAVEPSTAGIDVDAIQPAVTSVGVPASATYIAGQDLDFTVNLNKTVTVDTSGGTPYITLTLDSGGTVDAHYISGSGTSTLTFRYVVANGNEDETGIALGNTLALNGGTINDSHGNAVDATLNGEASTAGVLVDAVPPVVSTITTTGTTLNNQSSETFTVTFSEAVSGVDASDFTLHTTGTAAGTVGSVTTSDNITYTVTVGSVTGDGALRLDLNGSGTGIADLATNAITTGFTSGQSYAVDHTAPTVTAVTVPADATYTVGQTLNFTVTFSEPITVDTTGGAPRIAIALDVGGPVYADYVSGSGNTLTFQHTVLTGEQDFTGIATAASIALNGATIRDAATNAAVLTLTGEPSTAGVKIDANPQAPAPVSSLPAPPDTSPPVVPVPVPSAPVGLSADFSPSRPGFVAEPSYSATFTENANFAVPVAFDGRLEFQSPLSLLEAQVGGDVVSVQAKQTDGMPLPSWLHFDADTGKFTGEMPKDLAEAVSGETSISIALVVRNSRGDVSQVNFTIDLSASGRPQTRSPHGWNEPTVREADALPVTDVGHRIAEQSVAISHADWGATLLLQRHGATIEHGDRVATGRPGLSDQLKTHGWVGMKTARLALLESVRRSASR
ncbi:DUF4347 domain-containing protein [Telmatospirillum sp.]|uniref:DUF4347 domain-containing protein n=1 Tax=Telmatospirillum sp. TaxID=2079197 RepID=UPI00284CA6A0|nr:DUF4347 domain-containing protein [Telmatospirillum sp.]MDR3440647.1 DUF4347 domain-containing protein [Telmatospirillum sp.]